jgi:hypothetical protein
MSAACRLTLRRETDRDRWSARECTIDPSSHGWP